MQLAQEWLNRCVLFAGAVVVVCGLLLALRSCRSADTDRPAFPPTLGPVR
jgi:hypothetical protein